MSKFGKRYFEHCTKSVLILAYIDVLINFDVLFSCLFTCYSSLTSDLYSIYAENATAVALHGGRGGLGVRNGAEGGGGRGGESGAESVLIDSTLMLIFKQKQTNLVIFPKFY